MDSIRRILAAKVGIPTLKGDVNQVAMDSIRRILIAKVGFGSSSLPRPLHR
jgi:hypothetical protein